MNALTENETAAVCRTITALDYNNWIQFIDVASKKTAATYERAIRQFNEYCSANNIQQPTRQNIIEYREYLRLTKKPATVNAYLIAVKLFFRYMDDNGLYPDVADHVKMLKINKLHKRDILSDSERADVLTAANARAVNIIGKRDKAIILLMLDTALRDIEISRLNVNDIIECCGVYGLNVQRKAQTEKTAIAISNRAYDAIRDYLAETGRVINETDDSALFGSQNHSTKGQRIPTESISRIVKETLRTAGIDSSRKTAHSLRKTAITKVYETTKDIYATQIYAGHSSPATTQIYIQTAEWHKTNLAEMIAN